MATAAFFHGFWLAFGLILPLGAQNIFVFTQGLQQRYVWQSFPAVVTAALCDTFLITMAVQGAAVIAVVSWSKALLVCAGVIFLAYTGWLSWRAQPDSTLPTEAQPLAYKKQVLLALALSLLNPHAIMDTLGVIGTSSLQYRSDERLLFMLACIMVSWLWFFGLAISGKLLGRQGWFFTKQRTFNKLSAVFMWGAALYMLQGI